MSTKHHIASCSLIDDPLDGESRLLVYDLQKMRERKNLKARAKKLFDENRMLRDIVIELRCIINDLKART